MKQELEANLAGPSEIRPGPETIKELIARRKIKDEIARQSDAGILRGVYRFKSFEEADEWERRMRSRKVKNTPASEG
jgi:hypothetical protein